MENSRAIVKTLSLVTYYFKLLNKQYKQTSTFSTIPVIDFWFFEYCLEKRVRLVFETSIRFDLLNN